MDLPSTSTAFASGATEDQFKAFLQGMRDYIAVLLGEDGTQAGAKAALGISEFISTVPNGYDLVLNGAYKRIKGDFSNSGHQYRVLFEDASSSASTSVGVVPSRIAGVGSSFRAYSVHPETLDGPTIAMVAGAPLVTPHRFVSGRTSAASPYNDVAVNIADIDVQRWNTDGSVVIGGSTSGGLKFSVTDTGMKRIGWSVDGSAGYCYSDGNAYFGSIDAAGVAYLVAGNAVRWTVGSSGDSVLSTSKNSALTVSVVNTNTGTSAVSEFKLQSSSGTTTFSRYPSTFAGGRFANYTAGAAAYFGTSDNNLVFLVQNSVASFALDGNKSFLSVGGGLNGYGAGSGGAYTQTTSRTSAVTLNKPSGDITLVTAAGSTTPASFVVNCNLVAATDVPTISVRSATNKYVTQITNVTAGVSFEITFWTTGGTATDTPIFHFNLDRGSNA